MTPQAILEILLNLLAVLPSLFGQPAIGVLAQALAPGVRLLAAKLIETYARNREMTADEAAAFSARLEGILASPAWQVTP